MSAVHQAPEHPDYTMALFARQKNICSSRQSQLRNHIKPISPSQTLKRRSMVLAGEVTLTLALGGACSPNSLSNLSLKLVKREVPPGMPDGGGQACSGQAKSKVLSVLL